MARVVTDVEEPQQRSNSAAGGPSNNDEAEDDVVFVPASAAASSTVPLVSRNQLSSSSPSVSLSDETNAVSASCSPEALPPPRPLSPPRKATDSEADDDDEDEEYLFDPLLVDASSSSSFPTEAEEDDDEVETTRAMEAKHKQQRDDDADEAQKAAAMVDLLLDEVAAGQKTVQFLTSSLSTSEKEKLMLLQEIQTLQGVVEELSPLRAHRRLSSSSSPSPNERLAAPLRQGDAPTQSSFPFHECHIAEPEEEVECSQAISSNCKNDEEEKDSLYSWHADSEEEEEEEENSPHSRSSLRRTASVLYAEVCVSQAHGLRLHQECLQLRQAVERERQEASRLRRRLRRAQQKYQPQESSNQHHDDDHRDGASKARTTFEPSSVESSSLSMPLTTAARSGTGGVPSSPSWRRGPALGMGKISVKDCASQTEPGAPQFVPALGMVTARGGPPSAEASKPAVVGSAVPPLALLSSPPTIKGRQARQNFSRGPPKNFALRTAREQQQQQQQQRRGRMVVTVVTLALLFMAVLSSFLSS